MDWFRAYIQLPEFFRYFALTKYDFAFRISFFNYVIAGRIYAGS